MADFGAKPAHELAEPKVAAEPTPGQGLSLDVAGLVPAVALGTGERDGTKFLRDDRTWADPPGGVGGGAPADAKYIVQTAHADLSAEQALSSLATGVVKVTSGTGVLSTATADTDYATPGYVNTAVSTHAAAADPHTGYQKESEKGAAGGYASLDGSGTIPDAQIPASITRDTELSTHEADTTSVHGIADTSTLYRAGGTDVALADGGTGASLTDPNADRIMFWDDSAGAVAWLAPGTNLTITGTTLDAAGGSGVPTTIASVGGIQCFQQSADLTNATTTASICAGASFTFAANGVYVIDLYLMATSGASTTGYAYTFDTSVAVTYVGLTFTHQLATTGTITGGDSLADTTVRGLSSGVPAVTVTNMILGKGVLLAAGTGGTCQLMFRPEVAATATAKQNSVVRVQRVA